MKRLGSVLGLTLLTLSTLAHAEPRPPRALEYGGFAGYNRMVNPRVDSSKEESSFNGGAALSAWVLFRSEHPLSPFFELGYASMYASTERVATEEFGDLRSENSLSTMYAMFGPAFELDPVCVRGGLGWYRLAVESTVLGHTIHPSEYDMGWLLAVSVTVWTIGGVRLAPEVRGLLISEGSTGSVSLGVSGRGDLFSF